MTIQHSVYILTVLLVVALTFPDMGTVNCKILDSMYRVYNHPAKKGEQCRIIENKSPKTREITRTQTTKENIDRKKEERRERNPVCVCSV